MSNFKAGYKHSYWFVDMDGDGNYVVCKDVNMATLKHLSRYIIGNMFPNESTAKEAIAKRVASRAIA